MNGHNWNTSEYSFKRLSIQSFLALEEAVRHAYAILSTRLSPLPQAAVQRLKESTQICATYFNSIDLRTRTPSSLRFADVLYVMFAKPLRQYGCAG